MTRRWGAVRLCPGSPGHGLSEACRPAVVAALVALAIVGAVAGCGSPPNEPPGTPSLAPTATPAPTPTPTATPSPATPSPTTQPSPPAGTVLVDIPEGGVLLPVPAGWVQVPAGDLADPARRAELAALYPGSGTLLEQTDRLDGRATPVFLAVDPSAADRDEPLAANVSVLATQPSVGGTLLDIAASFIGDGMAETLGATAPPVRERVTIAAGDAVRIRMQVPPRDGHEILATAWVIGAPGGTLLITLLGPEEALAGLDPDVLAAAIVPSTSRTP